MLDEVIRTTLKAAGPFLSVSLDVSRTDQTSAYDVEQRWAGQMRRLLAAGAPHSLVTKVGELITASTGRRGETSRLIIATAAEGVLLDQVWAGRPLRDDSTWGVAPQLLPLVRGLQLRADHLLVKADRAGADVEMWGALGNLVHREQVSGTNDVLQRVPAGATSGRGAQARAEDSWARNAAEVAHEVDRLVRQFRPKIVVLDGDPTEVADIGSALEGGTRAIAVSISAGGRAAGISASAQRGRIDEAVLASQRVVVEHALDQFSRAEGNQTAAVRGLVDVVDALRREQVIDLFLADDPTSTEKLWVGPHPTELATSAEELSGTGVARPEQVRADVALIRAALGGGARVLLFDREEARVTHGVAAHLRWSDRSTPHDRVPSMPGHGRPGRHRD